jgi:hypothetical protein
VNRRQSNLALASLLLLAVSHAHASRELVETRTLRETVSLSPDEQLIVDNLYGSIKITGYQGSEVRVVAVETASARSRERLERARREVSLEIKRTAAGVVICADGPFRDPDDCTEWLRHSRHDPDYKVSYELDLQVPRDLRLEVQTVEGDIRISGVRGKFDVHGVNGGIKMSEIVGSGHARTVNGPVRVSFLENPGEDSEFKTVNGKIDVEFQAGLSADLSFKTMNGDVLTDFEYELLPPSPTVRKSDLGKTIWQINPRSGIRIASGGPHFDFENINGDILIRRGR